MHCWSVFVSVAGFGQHVVSSWTGVSTHHNGYHLVRGFTPTIGVLFVSCLSQSLLPPAIGSFLVSGFCPQLVLSRSLRSARNRCVAVCLVFVSVAVSAQNWCVLGLGFPPTTGCTISVTGFRPQLVRSQAMTCRRGWFPPAIVRSGLSRLLLLAHNRCILRLGIVSVDVFGPQ